MNKPLTFALLFAGAGLLPFIRVGGSLMIIPRIRRGPHCARRMPFSAAVLAAILLIVFGSVPAVAGHVPAALDVPFFWTPANASAGYLNFMTPAIPPVFPTIATEEHTGWTDLAGTGFPEPVGAVFPGGPDNDPHAGDRADFDWVQEHRADETALPPISNHPGITGFMGWEVAPTLASPHLTVAVPHVHGAGSPTLALPDYGLPFFNQVDVFSNISTIDADVGGPREAALDYFVEFSNTVTLAISPGVPTIVFVPGWTGLTTADDFVARWVPAVPGLYNQIAIDPEFPGTGHDEVTEIDAVVASIPEPSTFLLGVVGLFSLGWLGWRRRRRA
jgi:PEP-CTERM motif